MIHSRNGYFALPAEARAAGLAPFEVPLLSALSAAKISDDVKFRAGVALLHRGVRAPSVSILMEVPLHELQAKAGPAEDCRRALLAGRPGEGLQRRSGRRSSLATAFQP